MQDIFKIFFIWSGYVQSLFLPVDSKNVCSVFFSVIMTSSLSLVLICVPVASRRRRYGIANNGESRGGAGIGSCDSDGSCVIPHDEI
jgi:hypothetical protein